MPRNLLGRRREGSFWEGLDKKGQVIRKGKRCSGTSLAYAKVKNLGERRVGGPAGVI